MSDITTIGVGSAANDGTGDSARTAFQACNTNFSNLNTDKLEATDLEGTAILSTGEVGGTKFLREDGDGTSSWQAIPAPEGTSVLSTGPVTDGYVLTADGAGGAAWEAAAGGGLTNWEESTTTLQPTTSGYNFGAIGNLVGDITSNGDIFTYNLATDASNYERGFMKWNTNVLEIGTEAAGTGTARELKLSSATGTIWSSGNFSLSSGKVYFAGGGAAVGFGSSSSAAYIDGQYGAQFNQSLNLSSGDAFRFTQAATKALNASSGGQAFLSLATAINQSGTAGYTGIKLDVTETATGSGTNRLLDLRVASTTKFAVENDGTPIMGTHSAISAETVTGYITIKDSSGTTRKLAVVS